MYLDFHYYIVKVLARKAGFDETEAQDIAYASQYVDDALEYMPMDISGLPGRDNALLARADIQPLLVGTGADERFDVVCTAHDAFTMYGGGLPLGQKHTYVPFHFVPRSRKGDPDFDWRTAPDCPIARKLVEIAVDELKVASGPQRVRKCIKLGIALHTYADTWAHKDFSGRFNAEHNAVADAFYLDGGAWNRLDISGKPAKAPETGHAKASYFPDASHLHWKYKNGTTREHFDRNNPVLFLEAAETIYKHLCRAAGTTPDWSAIRGKIEDCLLFGDGPDMSKQAVERKNDKIRATFGDVAFSYDEYEWKEAALIPLEQKNGALIELSFRSDDLNLRERGGNINVIFQSAGGLGKKLVFRFKEGEKNNLKWFYFHIEASAQRHYVLDNVDPISETLDLSQASNVVHNVVEDLLNGLPVRAATELQRKKHWLTIAVKNATQYPILWKGHHDGDFSHSHGRYWDRPAKVIPSFDRMDFSVCERDQALTGVGGIAPFVLLRPDGTELPINIAFSDPLISDDVNPLTPHKVKCRATFDNDLRAVWSGLNSRYENIDKGIKEISEQRDVSDTLAIKLTTRIAKEAEVLIEMRGAISCRSVATATAPDSTTLDVFAISGDGLLSHRRATDRWGEWEADFGGAQRYTRVAMGGTRIAEVFAVRSDRVLQHKTFDGAWSEWTTPNFGGGLPDKVVEVVPVRNPNGNLEVFVIDADGQLYHNWQTADAKLWHEWQRRVDAPAVKALAAGGSQTLEVFGIGADDRLYHSWFDADGWHDFQPFGDLPPASAVTSVATVTHRNMLNVLVVTEDGILHQTRADAGGWKAWTRLSAFPIVKAAAGVSPHDNIELFAVGVRGELYHRWSDNAGAGWSDWTVSPSDAPLVNDVVLGRGGNMEAFIIRKDDGMLCHNWLGSAGGWQNRWAVMK